MKTAKDVLKKDDLWSQTRHNGGIARIPVQLLLVDFGTLLIPSSLAINRGFAHSRVRRIDLHDLQVLELLWALLNMRIFNLYFVANQILAAIL